MAGTEAEPLRLRALPVLEVRSHRPLEETAGAVAMVARLMTVRAAQRVDRAATPETAGMPLPAQPPGMEPSREPMLRVGTGGMPESELTIKIISPKPGTADQVRVGLPVRRRSVPMQPATPPQGQMLQAEMVAAWGTIRLRSSAVPATRLR